MVCEGKLLMCSGSVCPVSEPVLLLCLLAHINALTSKVALLRKLPDDWKHNISCWFK